MTHNDLHSNNIMYIKTENNFYITKLKITIIKFLHLKNF